MALPNLMAGDLLRFTTAGAVDDGKSTLIGRLLFETRQILDDHMLAVKKASRDQRSDYINFAFITDGLKAEREQGITIDVAYRYFATPVRKFIIADTPGHLQYTRNMATGASTANLAIILVDARKGMSEQSRRHALIASLLGVQHFIVCVNKMDLVDYAVEQFERAQKEFTEFAARLNVADIVFIPISALHGDNVAVRSSRMSWYEGATLLYHLENVHFAGDTNLIDVRFPVQYVLRPLTDEHHDYRGYAGQIVSGILRPGDEVVVLPQGFGTRVKSIETYDGQVDAAFPNMSVTVRLEDELDVSRGDMICRLNNKPVVGQDLDAMLCWFDETPMASGMKYSIKHTTRSSRALVKALCYRLDVNTLRRDMNASVLTMNDIGRVTIRTTTPLFYDLYRKNRGTGSFILINESTNQTSAAGMII